ncbi:MAG: VanZ family protein [Aeoliella sp.]
MSNTRIWIYRILLALFGLFLGWVVLRANLGELPSLLRLNQHVPLGDKIGHFVLMGTLCLLANLALRTRSVELKRRQALVGTIVVAVGVSLEELSQLAIASRSFSITDLAADYFGIFVADRVSWRFRSHPQPSLQGSDTQNTT